MAPEMAPRMVSVAPRRAPPPDLETGEDAASLLPAFVIDMAPKSATCAPGAAALVAANAAGWQVWGLPAVYDPRSPLVLDRAMPALALLPRAARSGDPDGGTLTFWTARGLLRLRCRVEAIEPGRFLVRGLAGAAAPQTAEAADRLREGRARFDDPSTPDLARLAHEVRTPLGAAIAYAEVLKDEHFGPLGNARYREYARTIHDSARLALSVVDGTLAPMLAGERGGTGLPELAFRDLDPAGVIDNCVAVARPLAERAGLALIARCDPGTPHVIADEVSLKQMLLNLITNAIKFARPGDRVTLATAYGADGCLCIEVADTGPGMPGPESPSPLPSLSAGPEGAAATLARRGIGLPLTRALAEANGAALIVDSTPGHGTRATIVFGKDRVVPV
jgi:signal transduction histidine kinase